VRDIYEILTDECLQLPIGGKTYRIRPLGYKDELRIKAATALQEKAIKDGQPLKADPLSDEDFQRMTLGDVLAEMRDDNVPAFVILRASLTAHAYSTHGLTIAEMVWESGPSPEALAASMQAAARELANGTTSPGTPPPAPESSTKPPANTTTTKSPRKPRASRSNGPTYSPKET
jgi:hypothetical protein